MTAVPLIFGDLTAEHYEDSFHNANPMIDQLRSKMEVVEKEAYTADYLDPSKRSIANAVQIFFKDGSSTDNVVVEYPIGHRRRREAAIPLLKQKFQQNLATRFPAGQCQRISQALQSQAELEGMAVHEFTLLFVI
jgi:2-methylcitrate dehydratase